MRKTRRNTADSNTFRFFVAPAALSGAEVVLDDEALVHQLASVLRLQPGEQITLLDGLGGQYLVELTALSRRQVRGQVLQHVAAPAEPTVHLTLFQALLRAERFEQVLQKATELGIVTLTPLDCERGTLDREDLGARKIERWQRIMREAAEQSRRGKIPLLTEPQPFAAACTQATQADLALLLWEGQAPPLRTVLRERLSREPIVSLALLSGPEGGFTPGEVEQARSQGILPVSLGPRILRAETAPLAAAAILLYELGELD